VFSAAYYADFLFGMPPVLIARAFGKKVILNYRSGEAEDHLTRWRTAVPSMRLASAIVVPSGYLVEVFRRFGLSATYIYNIIELDRFHFRSRSPLRPVFLTTRLLEPLYNVPCVLRAFGKIQRVYPDASLTVGGDGYLRLELEQMAQDLHLNNVRFIGRIPFNRMPEIYDSSDIYLTATNLDNMPSSITECLAAGLPVVTTKAGGIPYIVRNEETCLMIDLNDDEAMAHAALRLLRDPVLAASIAKNGREASKQWTWESVGGQWVRLYKFLTTPN
jgi:glycosyltransferase involved in cell wall biosynthesis